MSTIKYFLVRLMVSPALPGIIFLIVTMLLYRFPPTKFNKLYGYRSKRSMLSTDTWNEANEYSSFLLNIFGIFAIVLGIILCVFIKDVLVIAIISIMVTIGISVLLIMLTEKRLNTLFDSNGKRKITTATKNKTVP